MAALTITVGPITASVQTTDAIATDMLTDYAAEYGLDPSGTAQERIQRVAQHIAAHIRDVARAHRIRREIDIRRAAVEVEEASKGWG